MALEDRREGDAENMAKRAQDAGGRFLRGGRGGGQSCQGGGVVEEELQLGGVAGGVVAEGSEDPGAAAGDIRDGSTALLAGTGRALALQGAGGEVRHQDGEAAADAADAVVQAGGEVAEDEDAAEDELGDGRKDPLKALGQLRGWVGGERVFVHDMFITDRAEQCKRFWWVGDRR